LGGCKKVFLGKGKTLGKEREHKRKDTRRAIKINIHRKEEEVGRVGGFATLKKGKGKIGASL